MYILDMGHVINWLLHACPMSPETSVLMIYLEQFNEWKNIPVGYSGNFIDPLLEGIVEGRQQNSGEEGLKAGKISTFLDLKFSYQSNPCCIKIRILLVLEFRLHNLNYKWNIFHLEILVIVFWIINLPHLKTIFTSISSFKIWRCSVAESWKLF